MTLPYGAGYTSIKNSFRNFLNEQKITIDGNEKSIIAHLQDISKSYTDATVADKNC